MAKVTKHKTPSRARYEAKNPVISCRVSRELCEMMKKAKEVEHKSFTDLLKIGLGKQEIQAKKIKEAGEAGYKKGYADATILYKVTYHCSKCGQIIEVKHQNAKQAIDEYMREKGWSHNTCPPPRQ